jgi:DNA-binding NtrC family response regulator
MEPVVLFITPHERDVDEVADILISADLPMEHACCLAEARSKLARGRFKVVLTEAELRDGKWTDVMSFARQRDPGVQVIVTDPFADVRFWAEAINLGAYDVLAQPFEGSEVVRILASASGVGSRLAERPAAAAYFG